MLFAYSDKISRHIFIEAWQSKELLNGCGVIMKSYMAKPPAPHHPSDAHVSKTPNSSKTERNDNYQ